MNSKSKRLATLGASSLLAVAITACSQAPAPSTVNTPVNSTEASELAAIKAQVAQEQQQIATFDDLDFNVFSGQKWDELKHSHAANVIVHWPDGHTTTGIDVHIADLKKLFVYAPDTRIKVHPHKIAQGNLTAVTGVMQGTFTAPMPLGDGKFIQPTGKSFDLPMATIGRWENGVMQEEWLYWDNQTYMAQIGLGK